MLFDPTTTAISRRLQTVVSVSTAGLTQNPLTYDTNSVVSNILAQLCSDDTRNRALQYLSRLKTGRETMALQQPVLPDVAVKTLYDALIVNCEMYTPQTTRMSGPLESEQFYLGIAETIRASVCADEFEFLKKMATVRHTLHHHSPLSLVSVSQSRWLYKEGLFSRYGGNRRPSHANVAGSLTSILCTYFYICRLLGLKGKIDAFNSSVANSMNGVSGLEQERMFQLYHEVTVAMAVAHLVAPISSYAMNMEDAVATYIDFNRTSFGEYFSYQYKDYILRTPVGAVLGTMNSSTGSLTMALDFTIPVSLVLYDTLQRTKEAQDINNLELANVVQGVPKYKLFQAVKATEGSSVRGSAYRIGVCTFNTEKVELFKNAPNLPPREIPCITAYDPISPYVIPMYLGVGADTSLVAFTPSTRRALAVMASLYSKMGPLPLRDPLAPHHADSEHLANPESSKFPETFCSVVDTIAHASAYKVLYTDKKTLRHVFLPNMYIGLVDINSVLFGTEPVENQSDHNMFHAFTLRPRNGLDFNFMLPIHRHYYF